MVQKIWKVLVLTLVAAAGAAAGDIIRQRLTGEKGRILFRTSSGEWTVNVTPQMLIPAVAAGYRAEERGLLRAFGMAALMAGTGGKQLGGIAEMIRKRSDSSR